ncbi:F0F1 ATP synthase subunit gamma [Ahrensia sp. R2A130]|uniref:F0F1 ATP synthase subunit gamma n=1 Tax=Ahrensia sp. R2A130 TaxID=744979 RepID=UPI0001E0945A|nr:F0F1 ATP synthase subunit gamma [Ahrensia sp. R2A130]EFL89597.1 ATP synthase F1, gamma subunit [Ahrensia sp. R2A130]
MASLKDLRNRIASVKATQKITKAMQMVAAAKLRRAQSAAEAARPYSQRMDAVMANIANAVGDSAGAPKLLAGTGSDKQHLLIVCTAERGLCGGFNSSIARLARLKARELIASGKQVQILPVGKKGADVLKSEFSDIMMKTVDLREVKHVGYENAADIAKTVLDMFADDRFDVATLFYSEFKSVISQIPTAQQIIPPQIPEMDADAEAGGTIYDYEPDETKILDDLLPRNVAVQIFRALLENSASEQGARMSAMDNATRNAGEMIDKLTLTFNRQRQAKITTELIEIIAGAEAL